MMRVLVFLASLSFVAAQGDPPPFLAKAGCAVNVGDAVTSLVDASSHLYEGIETCTEAAKADNEKAFECTADMFELLASVAATSKYVVNVFGLCFDQAPTQIKCINTGLSLTEEIADIVASVSDIKTTCIDKKVRHKPPFTKAWINAKCVVDIQKATTFSLKTMAAATTIKKSCDHSSKACSASILASIGSLAGVAEFITATMGDCTSNIPLNAPCGVNIAKLIKALAGIAAEAPSVKAECSGGDHTVYEPGKTTASSALNGIAGGVDKSLGGSVKTFQGGAPAIVNDKLDGLIKAMAEAKYDARDNIPQASTSTVASLTTAALVAAIPVALALGFFGGRRTRAARVTVTQEEHGLVSLGEANFE